MTDEAKLPAELQITQTPSGVRFGLMNATRGQPAPTLIVLANDIEGTVGVPYFLQSGNQLVPQGWLCVSLDLPCHGRDRRAGEPEGLSGWSQRVDAGEDLLGDFERRVKDVLDHLVAEKYTDPAKIAACGTSRGAFVALHLAAGEPRVRCIVCIGPVIDLLGLDEFRGMSHPERAEALSAIKLVDKLVDRDVWMVIAEQDDRVGTDVVQAFAARLAAVAAEEKQPPSRIDFRIAAGLKGHIEPVDSAAQAAVWLAQRVTNNEQP